MDREKVEEGVICMICKRPYKNYRGLANHVTRTHRMKMEEYERRYGKVR